MSATATLSGKPVQDPREAIRWARNNASPTDFWGKANGYTCPLGPAAGTAWLLMLKKHLDSLQKNSYHTLRWPDSNTIGRKRIDVPRLVIVSAKCMNRALATDPNALYLVELKDRRHILSRTSINDQYNVLMPNPSVTSGNALYYTESLSGGTAYTWQTLVDDIWGKLPSSLAGAGAPTLPYTPDGVPANWRFVGMDAWTALHKVLTKIGCTTAFDPFAGSFSIVRLGATQAFGEFNTTDYLASFSKRLIYDYHPYQDLNLGHVPATVRVFFHRRELYGGLERDTPRTNSWEMTPVVTKDYSTGVTGATGTMVVWDDLPAEYDESLANTNSAALQTRANEIGANLANKLTVSEEGKRKFFSGIEQTFVPGSEITSVRWGDYGDKMGLITEVKQGPMPESVVSQRENEFLFDLKRFSPPLMPHRIQIVQVDDGTSTAGDDLSPNSDGLHPGFVLVYDQSGSYTQLDACWIRAADLSGTSESASHNLKQKDRYPARLAGVEDSGSDIRPVYIVRKGEGTGSSFTFDVSADNGSTVTINSSDTLDFDASDLTFSSEANSTDSLRGIVVEVETDGGDSTIKRIKAAVDKSVAQNFTMSGSFTGGGVVLVRDFTRNNLDFTCSTGTLPPIDMVAGTGQIDIRVRNPFHDIRNEDETDDEELDYQQALKFAGNDGCDDVLVTTVGNTVKVEYPAVLPVGSVIQGVLEPILDNGKYYLNCGGRADTDWALMDGTSNASPGSGIKINDTSSGNTYMVKGAGGTPADLSDDAQGRPAYGPDDDDDITLAISDHPDHRHLHNPDTCHADVAGTETHYDFTNLTGNYTGGMINIGSTSAETYDHDPTFTNNDAASVDIFNVAPPVKKLWYFERVAAGSNVTEEEATAARSYDDANNQKHTLADNAVFDTGSGDFTFSTFVRIDDDSRTNAIAGKFAAADREWAVQYALGTTDFRAFFSTDGTTNAATVDSASIEPQDDWVHIVVQHDNTNNLAILWVNGVKYTAALTGNLNNGTAAFEVGGYDSSSDELSGRQCCSGFWTRLLTAGEISQLSQGLKGLKYAAMSTALKVDLEVWYDGDEASGDLLDSVGSLDMSSSGTGTIGTGGGPGS